MKMNRKDKRRHKVDDDDPTVFMKESQLAAMRRKTKEVVIFEVSRTIMAVMSISLKDEHNFGKKRTNKIIDRIYSQLDCVITNVVKREEIFAWCRDNEINFESEHKVDAQVSTTLFTATAKAISG